MSTSAGSAGEPSAPGVSTLTRLDTSRPQIDKADSPPLAATRTPCNPAWNQSVRILEPTNSVDRCAPDFPKSGRLWSDGLTRTGELLLSLAHERKWNLCESGLSNRVPRQAFSEHYAAPLEPGANRRLTGGHGKTFWHKLASDFTLPKPHPRVLAKLGDFHGNKPAWKQRTPHSVGIAYLMLTIIIPGAVLAEVSRKAVDKNRPAGRS